MDLRICSNPTTVRSMLCFVMTPSLTHSDRLVTQHVDFARAQVRRFQAGLPRHVDSEALESDAMLGLLLAARSFDPARGVIFKTYAAKRIVGAMLDGLRQRQGGRRARTMPRTVSLSTPVYQQGQGFTTLGEVLAEERRPVGEGLEARDEVDGLLIRLDKATRRLVRQHYLEGLTQEQIGRRQGRSPSRVSQCLKSARAQLREVAWSN